MDPDLRISNRRFFPNSSPNQESGISLMYRDISLNCFQSQERALPCVPFPSLPS